MPFIIRKNAQIVKTAGDWQPIPIDEVRRYRKLFVQRHQDLLTGPTPMNLQRDFLSLTIDFKFFNTLVQQATIGHYLVAHFVCDPVDNGFENINLAFCIKEKDTAGVKDRIVGKIYNSQGLIITEDAFCKARGNYNGRLQQILKSSTQFANDRKGRAHEITEEMKTRVNEMGLVDDKVYIYFIVDDHLPGADSISVLYSDSEINFETIEALVEKGVVMSGLSIIFDAYDHGTACCPIG
ncbi:hypothetical protein GCM10007423_29010 [Dyadobacter endophyticus]|uniref:Uncharacterized protein n=1 Tax=Dyadobacter endophyticus TaxID=1749036 RepID=A0ABQ1YUJ7_9BACT|nr:hypothetical protein [Dyadobacter endophyticus]GGH36603.1 hypothetical protein GCM10007423_29010 [Dyadobacter endophyticus]